MALWFSEYENEYPEAHFLHPLNIGSSQLAIRVHWFTNFLSSKEGLYPDLQAMHLYPLSISDCPVLSYPLFRRSVNTITSAQFVGMFRATSGVVHMDSVAVVP